MVTVRILLILSHLLCFSGALFLVMREDIRLLLADRLQIDALETTAKNVSRALAGLFLTGSLITYVDTGFVLTEILARPKLLAKISVVLILTANGILMHYLVFPKLHLAAMLRPRWLCRVACGLGALSSVSWLYATFLGIAKPLTEKLGYEGFMVVYAVLVIGAVMAAQFFIVPRANVMLFGDVQGRNTDGVASLAPERS